MQNNILRIAGPFLGLLILFVLTSCGDSDSVAASERSALGEQLRNQIVNSCGLPIDSYYKEVTNLKSKVKEDSTWDFWPQVSIGEAEDGSDSLVCILLSELGWAMKSFHDAPSLKDYYDISAKGDSVLVQIKASSINQSDLKAQKYILDEKGEVILYWQSRYSKENWLYGLDVMVEIVFTDEGNYWQHNLKVNNEVSLMDSGFDAWIMGKAFYHE